MKKLKKEQKKLEIWVLLSFFVVVVVAVIVIVVIRYTIKVLFFQMAKCPDLDNDIDELIQDFESRRNKTVLHTVLFY